MTPRTPERGRLDFPKEGPGPLRKVWNVIKYPLLLAGVTAGAVYAGGALHKNLSPGPTVGHPWSRTNFAKTFYERVNSGTATHITGPMRQWAERNGVLGKTPPTVANNGNITYPGNAGTGPGGGETPPEN